MTDTAREGVRISMIAGFSDIDIAGNQSTKNALKHFEMLGYEVDFWSAFPQTFPNLQDPTRLFGDRIKFHRLPKVAEPWLRRVKGVKDLASRPRRVQAPAVDQPETYHERIGVGGRVLYIVGTFLLYLPFELTRVLFASRRRRPDLIYGLNWQGAIAGRIVARILHLPLLTRFHGVTLTADEVSDWRRVAKVLDEYVGLKIKSDAVVMTNDGTAGDVLLNRLGIPASRVHFWMNGLDLTDLTLPSDFDRDRWRHEHNLERHRIVLMVSRLAGWKRVDRGILALKRLRELPGHDDVVLVIVGDGADRAALEDLARRTGVDSATCFVGAIPHREVAEYFSCADVFVSLYDGSNLGNPLLEALWLGVPVVSIRDTGVDELVEQNGGCLVGLANVDTGVARAVSALLDRKDEASAVEAAEGGLAVGLESWARRMDREHRLIQQLVSRH